MGSDRVNHPSHYTTYKGLEIIDLTEQMNFNRGNAVKYITRAGLKDPDTEIEDLKKARWYVDREIQRLGNEVLDAKTTMVEELYQAGIQRMVESTEVQHEVELVDSIINMLLDAISPSSDIYFTPAKVRRAVQKLRELKTQDSSDIQNPSSDDAGKPFVSCPDLMKIHDWNKQGRKWNCMRCGKRRSRR